MAIGLTSMMIIKRAIRALPGVGPVARPILGELLGCPSLTAVGGVQIVPAFCSVQVFPLT